MESILELRGIVKRFPGVTALDGVDLSISKGEIHALVGQNGAGKSALIKVLSGAYPADEGEMRLPGGAVPASNTARCASGGDSGGTSGI